MITINLAQMTKLQLLSLIKLLMNSNNIEQAIAVSKYTDEKFGIDDVTVQTTSKRGWQYYLEEHLNNLNK